MTRAEKERLVADLASQFEGAGAIVVCDYRGMSVEELESVRNMARQEDVKVKVVKNTLARIALDKAGCEVPELKEMNLMVWGDGQVMPCKIADKAATEFKDKFKLKAGLIEGKVADMQEILTLAKLPSRDELLGMLLNVWNAPITNFTIGLKALADKKAAEAGES